MLKTVSVTIAGQEYTISPKPIGESRAWRERLGQPLSGLVGIFADAKSIQINNPADIQRVFEAFKSAIADAPDVILDLVCDYAPEIAGDRERIETEGFDYEIMEAFKEVLTLVYPFGTLMSFIRRRG